jgi:hypothetical protein
MNHQWEATELLQVLIHIPHKFVSAYNNFGPYSLQQFSAATLGPESTHLPNPIGSEGSFPGVKRSRREADHSPQSSTSDMNG